MSSFHAFPDPSTEASLAEARISLQHSIQSRTLLASRIADAELALQQIIADAQRAIDDMVREQQGLDERILHTRSYLAPIRRLPVELLRDIFECCFEQHACVAWVLSSVCVTWRRLALGLPRIWSKIRLVTNPRTSADTVRLWLERSGSKVPLDIEIYLRVDPSSSEIPSRSRSRRRRSSSPPPAVFYPSVSFHPNNQNALPMTVPTSITQFMVPHPATTPFVLPSLSHHVHDGWGSSPSHGFVGERVTQSQDKVSAPGANRGAAHWGYIAIYYLVEQMHRWERFIFRFDRQFSSIGAMKSINGDAPLLRDFEISCGEPSYYQEWPHWLPNLNHNPASPETQPQLPSLRSLTLQFTPFKWTSPMFQTNLHTLTLRALPSILMPLDRVLYIIKANKDTLQYLSMHFHSVTPAVLPLTPLTLPELKELSVGGSHALAQLIDTLIVPSIEELNLDLEARDPIEDVILSCIGRSGPSVALKHLSVAYGFGYGRRATQAISQHQSLSTSKDTLHPPSGANNGGSGNSSNFYYGPGGVVISWNFLSELTHLESLRVGGTPLENLLSALCFPEDDIIMAGPPGIIPPGGNTTTSNWLCPNLSELGMKSCHTHNDAISKLVQMVEARNPEGGGSGTPVNGISPKKIRSLELNDCNLGQDVVEWLQKKVPEVLFPEPVFDRQVFPLTKYGDVVNDLIGRLHCHDQLRVQDGRDES